MLFGNMLNLDKGIFTPISERPSSSKALSKYMSDLIASEDNLLKASAVELLRTCLLHMTTKQQNIHKEYLPNSYVLGHYRTGLPPTRLHTNWKGPMRVIKGLNFRYTLLDLITGKEKDYHVSDMKPYVYDSALVDPPDIARRDQMEYFIEKISDHRGKLGHSNFSLAGWDMMSHMILGNRSLICAIQIIFIPTCARKIFSVDTHQISTTLLNAV